MNVVGERFTEGPWRVTWSTDADGDPCFNVLKSDGDADDDGRMVDASYSIIETAYPTIDEEEARANADLIAAAPDLYVALKIALPWLQTWLKEYKRLGQQPATREIKHAIFVAESTLAYARGEDYRGAGDDL